MKADRSADPNPPDLVMRLYLARDGVNSQLALANLEALCAANDHREYLLEAVDVAADPQRALDQGIFITPALEIVRPEPTAIIYGNLSDSSALRHYFPAGPTG